MKIKKILLYNFKNFRQKTIIDFSDSITFLVGPNGFGKTTIFDAIELGLTGNISRITQTFQVTGGMFRIINLSFKMIYLSR